MSKIFRQAVSLLVAMSPWSRQIKNRLRVDQRRLMTLESRKTAVADTAKLSVSSTINVVWISIMFALFWLNRVPDFVFHRLTSWIILIVSDRLIEIGNACSNLVDIGIFVTKVTPQVDKIQLNFFAELFLIHTRKFSPSCLIKWFEISFLSPMTAQASAHRPLSVTFQTPITKTKFYHSGFSYWRNSR